MQHHSVEDVGPLGQPAQCFSCLFARIETIPMLSNYYVYAESRVKRRVGVAIQTQLRPHQSQSSLGRLTMSTGPATAGSLAEWMRYADPKTRSAADNRLRGPKK